MKRLITSLLVIFSAITTLKAQPILNINDNRPFEVSHSAPASKQLKTARFFIITGYILTGLGSALWLAESTSYQGDGKAPTGPYIAMTTVGIGSLILGYSLKSKALRNNVAAIGIAPQQNDLTFLKPGTASIIPSIKFKLSL